jgi:hypothetical protein
LPAERSADDGVAGAHAAAPQVTSRRIEMNTAATLNTAM